MRLEILVVDHGLSSAGPGEATEVAVEEVIHHITMLDGANASTHRGEPYRACSTRDLSSIHTLHASKDEPGHTGCLAPSCSHSARSGKGPFYGRH